MTATCDNSMYVEVDGGALSRDSDDDVWYQSSKYLIPSGTIRPKRPVFLIAGYMTFNRPYGIFFSVKFAL